MNLLGIIEILRRNLGTVVLGCYAVLALVVVLDVARLLSGGGHGAPAAHAAAPADHAAPAAHAPAGHAAPADLPAEAPAEAGGFWAAAHHFAEKIPAFWTAFGFLGCLLLVIVSKSYGHLGVTEREDYYNE